MINIIKKKVTLNFNVDKTEERNIYGMIFQLSQIEWVYKQSFIVIRNPQESVSNNEKIVVVGKNLVMILHEHNSFSGFRSLHSFSKRTLYFVWLFQHVKKPITQQMKRPPVYLGVKIKFLSWRNLILMR